MIEVGYRAAEILAREGIEARVLSLRFAQPLDEKLLLETIRKTRQLFTIEEHNLTGGLGSKVLEFLERHGVAHEVSLHRFALPNEFIEQGSREFLLDRFGLSPEKVASEILRRIRASGAPISLSETPFLPEV